MADYDIANFALKAACGANNELLYDDKGLPSVMVKIPKFKLSEVLTDGADEYHPAFIVNGNVLDYIYISKYQNVVENGRAYSKPGVDPQASISWTNAKAYCEAKGDGWHLMTKAEYAAIALWCKKTASCRMETTAMARTAARATTRQSRPLTTAAEISTMC